MNEYNHGTAKQYNRILSRLHVTVDIHEKNTIFYVYEENRLGLAFCGKFKGSRLFCSLLLVETLVPYDLRAHRLNGVLLYPLQYHVIKSSV
jgi:hypothetical protein